MADWSLMEHDWLQAPPSLPYDPYHYGEYDPYYREKPPPPQQPPVQQLSPQAQPYLPPPSTLTLLLSSSQHFSPMMPIPPPPPPASMLYLPALPKADNPREMRNKAEKQRRDKLNQSIAELATLVPPVVFSSRKIDKTGVLRYTAHYLRAHQYVFDPSAHSTDFTPSSTQALLGLLNGFLLTTTYKGLVVVVSQNVNEYLGYTELELLGRSIFGIVHEEDRQLLQDQLMPKSSVLGQNGEVVVPDEENGRQKVAQALANEKRRFVVRFMKLGQRSEPSKYVTCHVEGSLKMSDRACRGYNRCCQMVRRARARGDNPCSSGNDVVFIGVVRPATETFINESALESYKMEYRTRHSIDGEIIQCEQRIALVTGYMTNEVNGVNAMNFIHRDEVRWVIIALREMYKQNQLFGESCYRLMTKDGQFIYMRTRGRLDVDTASRAVTSFVCTNTVVEEEEGKYLIKMMKDRFTMQINNKDTQDIEDVKDRNQSQTVPVEDPRQLEKVILNLVTDLPSPQSNANNQRDASPIRGASPPRRLSIIPPKKERIVSAIERIYNVIKCIPKQPSILQEEHIPNETRVLTPTCSEASETTSSKEHLPIDSGSEVELNSEAPCSPATSLNFEIDITNSYDELISFCIEDDTTQPSNWCHTNWNPVGPDSSTRVVKRPRFDNQAATMGGDQIVASDSSGCESPVMDTFFDNATVGPLMELATNSGDEGDQPMESAVYSYSWDENIQPDLMELLSSEEVEKILGTIDGISNNK